MYYPRPARFRLHPHLTIPPCARPLTPELNPASPANSGIPKLLPHTILTRPPVSPIAVSRPAWHPDHTPHNGVHERHKRCYHTHGCKYCNALPQFVQTGGWYFSSLFCGPTLACSCFLAQYPSSDYSSLRCCQPLFSGPPLAAAPNPLPLAGRQVTFLSQHS